MLDGFKEIEGRFAIPLEFGVNSGKQDNILVRNAGSRARLEPFSATEEPCNLL